MSWETQISLLKFEFIQKLCLRKLRNILVYKLFESSEISI